MGQIPVFVINLDRSPERLAAISERLSRLGLTFERIAAVDGSKILKTKVLGPGASACFMSHIEAAKLILERGLDQACILEDDAIFREDFALFVQKESSYPTWADAIKLEAKVRRRLVLCFHVGRLRGSRIAYVPGNCANGSAAYILTRSGAEKVATVVSRIEDKGIDHALFDSSSCIRTVHVLPYPVHQSEASSTIGYKAKIKKRRTLRQIWQVRLNGSKALMRAVIASRKTIGTARMMRLALASVH